MKHILINIIAFVVIGMGGLTLSSYETVVAGGSGPTCGDCECEAGQECETWDSWWSSGCECTWPEQE